MRETERYNSEREAIQREKRVFIIWLISLIPLLSFITNTGYILATTFYLLLMVLPISLYLNKERKKKEKKLTAVKDQISIIQKELTEVIVVPYFYLHLDAINSFISYIHDERAATY